MGFTDTAILKTLEKLLKQQEETNRLLGQVLLALSGQAAQQSQQQATSRG